MPTANVEGVSLAESYFYAKWFASKNMGPGEDLEWQLGDPNDYFRFFMADTFIKELSPLNLPKTLVHYLTNRRTILDLKKERDSKNPNRLYNWVSSFRSDVSPATLAVDLLNGQSDVPNNFGAIFCLDKEKIKTFNLPLGGAHEVRTRDSVPASAIKAVGAPLRHIQEARELISGSHSRAELFALECAELHFASFPIKNLVARVQDGKNSP